MSVTKFEMAQITENVRKTSNVKVVYYPQPRKTASWECHLDAVIL